MEIKNIERALITRYRAQIYKPFITAICRYELLQDGDTVGVCLSGGKDSFTLAKLFQEYQKHGIAKINVKYLVMDPGFSSDNLEKLKENAERMGIPIIIRQSDVFRVAENHGGIHPCYLCARMRRGYLYKFAQEEGCNKIALGHHFDDAVETVLLNVIYGGCFGALMPKLKSKNYPGMELIRPMIFVEERSIVNFIRYCGIQPMNCGCRVAEKALPSKRREIKELIASLKKVFPGAAQSIYRSTENVNLDQVLGWKSSGRKYSFRDFYEDHPTSDEEE
jgi:tRNA(Ile)-lysidine synthase TilS/MesJ